MELILAKISRTSTSEARLVIDGETEATSKGYAFLESYSPVLNDRVLCAVVGDQYVVLGKVHTVTG